MSLYIYVYVNLPQVLSSHFQGHWFTLITIQAFFICAPVL